MLLPLPPTLDTTSKPSSNPNQNQPSPILDASCSPYSVPYTGCDSHSAPPKATGVPTGSPTTAEPTGPTPPPTPAPTQFKSIGDMERSVASSFDASDFLQMDAVYAEGFGSKGLIDQLENLAVTLRSLSLKVHLGGLPLLPGFTVPPTTTTITPSSEFGFLTDGKEPSKVEIAGTLNFKPFAFQFLFKVSDLALKLGSGGMLKLKVFTVNAFYTKKRMAINFFGAGSLTVHQVGTAYANVTGQADSMHLMLKSVGGLQMGKFTTKFFMSANVRLRSKKWCAGKAHRLEGLDPAAIVAELNKYKWSIQVNQPAPPAVLCLLCPSCSAPRAVPPCCAPRLPAAFLGAPAGCNPTLTSIGRHPRPTPQG